MNKKKTNYLIVILNIIIVISCYIAYFSADYLKSSILIGGEVTKSIYDSFIIDFFVLNASTIISVIFILTGIFDIVCGIQNRKNKKIFFWMIVIALSEIWFVIINLIDNIIIHYINIFLLGIVPIIFAIKNLIHIRKNKPKVVQILSYIATIIISILQIIDVLDLNWSIIAIVMLLIYIHYQEKNIEESKTRKITNIILYWILQLILSIGFLALILLSLLITKINSEIRNNQIVDLSNEIMNFSASQNEEKCFPVENDNKFGFINENGEEIIPCEYDRVSDFLYFEDTGGKYYFAFANKGNEYYIISKENETIQIEDDKYIKVIDELTWNQLIYTMNNNEFDTSNYNRRGYISAFTTITTFVFSEKDLNFDDEEIVNNEIELEEQNGVLYYNNGNFVMLLKPVEDGDYDEFEVTIIKNNGERNSYTEYIPEYDEDDNTIETYKDNEIEFISLDENTHGWYDQNGNKIVLPSDYDIQYVSVKYAVLELIDNEYYCYYLIDMINQKSFKSDYIGEFNNGIIIKNQNNKIVAYDENLNVISKEYDRIIIDLETDMAYNLYPYV